MREAISRHLAVLSVVALLAAAAVVHVQMARGAESGAAAVQRAVEASGTVYAGDCAATVSPRDIGATCSRLAGEERGVQAFLVGRTFSEFNRWVFVAQSSGGEWRVIAEKQLDLESDSPVIPWP